MDILTIIYLLIYISIPVFLYNLGKKEKNIGLFMLICIFPNVLLVLMMIALMSISGIFIPGIIILIIFLIERILWSITLFGISGDEKPATFTIVYLIPLAWLFYRAFKGK